MTTFIRELSDLHCEFHPFVVPPLPEDKETVLVLAGDIDLCHRQNLIFFLQTLSQQFKHIIYVFGNHEFYKNSLSGSINKFKQKLKNENINNVSVLDNESIIINDIAFVGGTMWTDFDNHNPLTMIDAEMYMSDYLHIRTGNKNNEYMNAIKTNDIYIKHIETRNYIFEECKKHKDNNLKVVVVTHHSPSFGSVSEGYRGNIFNTLYHSNLDNLILDSKIDIWFHGHVHQSFDYKIDSTRIIVNPRGYHPMELNPLFNDKLRIEL